VKRPLLLAATAAALIAPHVQAAPAKKGLRRTSYTTRADSHAPRTTDGARGSDDDRTGHVGAAASAGLLYVGLGYGVEGWYDLTPRLQLGLGADSVSTEIDAGKQNPDSDAALKEYLSVRLLGAKARARFFVFHSFFLSGAASVNQVTGKYGYRLGDGDDFLGRKYAATMTMAHLGLGNQWRLRNGLILGGEWASAAAHLSTSVKEKGQAGVGEGATGTDVDAGAFQETVASKLDEQISYTIAMLTLGYEF
jgi:hypothetical protein